MRMAIIECKMCGGSLEIIDGLGIATCEYCGTAQTLPRLSDDKRANLYNRANHFRRSNEYDKAMSLYEQILTEDSTDAEAYWSLVLCRYGIEYVEDPTTHKRIPTVHRTQFTSIFADEDYKSALQYADYQQKAIYEEEAKTIDAIQKGILALSKNEAPYDVFICYKETDENGSRTPDSVIANDIYYQLTSSGFKVFYAAITLEDKLGSAYEPCIFAALNSAKVMLAIGTKPEYFQAVWVKNEWSRFLQLMKQDRSKTLIPCYKDMDAYHLPDEFAHLQAQDMGKIGFINDIIRGINKIIVGQNNPSPSFSASANPQTTDPLLDRVFIFLEDGDWRSADTYCEKVLDIDPKNATAYLGKLMAELKVSTRTNLAFVRTPFTDNINYKRILRYGSPELIAEIKQYAEKVTAAHQQNQQHILDAQRRMQQQAAIEAQKRAAAAQSAAPDMQTQRLANLTQRYQAIPTEEQIRETVKEQPEIRQMRTLGIVFLFLSWPIGLIILFFRNKKINDAIAQENAKYDAIRQEYLRMTNE